MFFVPLGRVVALRTGGPGFGCRPEQNLFYVYCVDVTKIKKKKPGMAKVRNIFGSLGHSNPSCIVHCVISDVGRHFQGDQMVT